MKAICVLVVNPGAMVHAGILSKMNSLMRYVVGPVAADVFRAVSRVNPDGIMRMVEKSTADIQRAASSLDDAQLGGHPKGLYIDGPRIVRPAESSFDKAKQRELWDFSMELVGLDEDDVLR